MWRRINGHPVPTATGTNGFAAAIYLYAADLVLEDTTRPVVGNVGGALAESSTVSGKSDVEFDASDTGPGVYEVTFTVDGTVVRTEVLNTNYGRCQDVGQTTDGLPAFLYTQPCPPEVSVDVPFDTTSLSDGEHQLVVNVSDASGNTTIVLDRKITVANATTADGPGTPPGSGSTPPGSGSSPGSEISSVASSASSGSSQSGANASPELANGTNASTDVNLIARWSGTSRAHLTSNYGHPRSITGQLTTSAGKPIAGALINVTATPAYDGAKSITLTSPHTGPQGRFVVRLPGGTSSRTVRLAYRANLTDPEPVSTRTLMLSVRAGITLQIAPRIASAGRTIHFKGVLRGAPIPPGGKQLVLEARSPGSSWIQFHVIRTAASGSFQASYRFRLSGPVEYRFRVVSNYEADFPFGSGSSNVVGVNER